MKPGRDLWRPAAPGVLDLPIGGLPLLMRYVRRHLRLSAGLLVAVTGGAVSAVAAQYGLKLLVDAMTAPTAAAGAALQAGRAHVFALLGVFLGLLAFESACWRVGGWLGGRAMIRVARDIRLDLFGTLSARPWRFFNGQASGALASRITAAATSATAVMRTVVWNLLPPITDIVGSVVVLTMIDWRIGAGLVVAAAGGTWALHRLGNRGFPLHHAHHSKAAEVAGSLGDVLANMSLVRAYGARGREQESLRQTMLAEGRAHAASWMFLERLRCGHDAAFWLATAAVLTAAVWEWSRGAMTTGGVVVASTLTLRILAGSRELALSLLGVTQQLGAVSEALEALRPAPDEAEPPGLPALRTHGAGEIELSHVRYAPDQGYPLFHDLNLRIPAGQRVGVVGLSGAGKSTLLRLIQGMVEPQRGEVLLDGQRLADHAREGFAGAFCVVTQEVALFHRSIADNLRYGRPDAPWDEVLGVSRAVGCDAFVRELPQGYDTIVGERGIRLSGGQRQRLAVARALLRHAPVLLLDEATSALDSHAEMQVQRALLTWAGGRTVLAVAHRLSTLMEFDRVVVLQDGQIVEDGSPDELRRGTGQFAATWQLQQRHFDTNTEVR